MRIEIFPSASGDCVLVTSADGKRLLADAGLPDAYEAYIADPLSRLHAAGEVIDVAYVSHIDRDHIGGILRLLDYEIAWRAYDHSQGADGRLRQPKVPRPPKIGEIWHNAFLEDIERTEKVDLGTALIASAGVLAGLNAAALGDRDSRQIAATAQMLALSVGDAIEVNWRIGTDQLDIPLNPAFGGKLMTARPKGPIALGSLSITVLGPTNEQLRELRTDWIVWLKKSKDYVEKLRKQHQRDADAIGSGASALDLAGLSRDIALGVEKDVTPPNLASLVLLVEEGGKRLLLTGDAGDESLLSYLKDAKLLDASGRITVDVLKVPHHGAHNSYSKEFVKAVRARHLIFCGDGEHHNPEPDVVQGYINAIKAAPLAGGEQTTFWFNWSSVRAGDFLDLWDELEGLFDSPACEAGIVRRSLRKNEGSMTIDLSARRASDVETGGKDMALVGASTAWEECRIALGAAILHRHGVTVSGSDWTKLKPAPNMPDGLGSSATAWHATLDEAQDDLEGQGYGCSAIDATEVPAVLNAILTKSTRLLFNHITAMRLVR